MILPSLGDTIRHHQLWPKKSLGQHFLHHPQLIAKIARAAGDLTQHTVIEIGPGPGGLTRALLEAGAKQVIAIEKDTQCVAALQELVVAAEGRLQLIEADALTLDPNSLGEHPRKIVANLPYNISTALLLFWLTQLYSPLRHDVVVPAPPQGGGKETTALPLREGGIGDSQSGRGYPPLPIISMTLMFQKEVAQRLWAQPSDSAYGRLSVITQFFCNVEKAFDIAPEAFIPPPKVMSTVVNIFPRPQPVADIPLEALEKVTAAAFGQRRKMLRASLKSLGVDAEALLAKADIDPTRRAETLSVEEFCRLAKGVTSGRE